MEKLQIYFDCPGIPKMYMCFKHGSSIFFISDYAAGGPFDKFLRFNCKIRLISRGMSVGDNQRKIEKYLIFRSYFFSKWSHFWQLNSFKFFNRFIIYFVVFF